MDTLIKIYDSKRNLLGIREVIADRNEIASEMKKVAKKFKGAAFLWAENMIDKISYDIKKKEFTYNAI